MKTTASVRKLLSSLLSFFLVLTLLLAGDIFPNAFASNSLFVGVEDTDIPEHTVLDLLENVKATDSNGVELPVKVVNVTSATDKDYVYDGGTEFAAGDAGNVYQVEYAADFDSPEPYTAIRRITSIQAEIPATIIKEEEMPPAVSEAPADGVLPDERSLYGAEKLYQGYHEMISVKGENLPMHVGIRIKDGFGVDGRDNIAYCYDLSKKPPTEENAIYPNVDDRCFYTRQENYIQSNDPYINAYGTEKKQKIALALYVGYPCDAYGHYEQQFKDVITADEARFVTQYLLWDITKDQTKIYTPTDSFSQKMCDYYNFLYTEYIRDFVAGTEFFPSSVQITGDFTARYKNGEWEIGPLSLHGIQGASFHAGLFTSDPDMRVCHAATGKPVSAKQPLVSGEPFLIKTPNNPQSSVVGLNWLCDSARFYFYTYVSGGNGVAGGKANIQNLIRVEACQDDDIIWLQFDEAGTAEEMPNETLEFSLKKEWSNAAPDEVLPSVKVWVLADGERLLCCELNKENGWQTSVTVPKFHLNGNAIVYSVEETPIPAGYSSKVTGDVTSGFLITNTKLNSLLLSKTVTGEMGDKTKLFTFHIRLNSTDGTPLSGSFPYAINVQPSVGKVVENEIERGTIMFDNGVATVQLSHNQQIQIYDIPYGTGYSITEEEANQDGYATSFHGSGQTGTLDRSQEVHIINRKDYIPETGLSDTGSHGMVILIGAAILGLSFSAFGSFISKKRFLDR